MKKSLLCLFLFLFVMSMPVFGEWLERVHMGGGSYLNYVFAWDYRELETFASSEFGVRINIGGTTSWEDNTYNENLASAIRSLMRQHTQQGRYDVYAMLVFTNNFGDVEEIIVNLCYQDNNSVYRYFSTYWYF